MFALLQGGSVLRMLADAIGERVFNDGIKVSNSVIHWLCSCARNKTVDKMIQKPSSTKIKIQS